MLTEARRNAVRGFLRLADAAATPHGIDRYVELLAPTWSTTEVRGRVVEVRRQTPGTVTLTIAANRNWTGFRAGQHTLLTVEIDGVRHTRCYSMTGSAVRARGHQIGRGQIELTVKAHPHGKVSNFLVSHAAPGLVVGLSPAQGDFTLPGAVPDQLLLVSGGSGITPVLSMLRTLCDQGHQGAVTFVHYSMLATDMPYRAELDALARAHPNVRLVRVCTDEPGAGDLDGFLDEAQLQAIDRDWKSAEAFVCGPSSLMSAITDIYARHELSAHVHTEAFTLSSALSECGADGGAGGGTVRFAGSTASVVDDGRVLLAQAEAAGLSPASGCRMGICHTCACPLLSGTVSNVVTGETTRGEGGDVRICVSVAVGDVELGL